MRHRHCWPPWLFYGSSKCKHQRADNRRSRIIHIASVQFGDSTRIKDRVCDHPRDITMHMLDDLLTPEAALSVPTRASVSSGKYSFAYSCSSRMETSSCTVSVAAACICPSKVMTYGSAITLCLAGQMNFGYGCPYGCREATLTGRQTSSSYCRPGGTHWASQSPFCIASPTTCRPSIRTCTQNCQSALSAELYSRSRAESP